MADNYLVHFNQNHNRKTGRFDFGDGDGDGIRDDHAHRSLADKARAAKDAHRGRVLENENYKVAKGSIKLQQDQIANRRNQEQTSVKARNMDMKSRKRQERLEKEQLKRQKAMEREEQRRQMQEAKAQRMIDSVRQKSLLDLERAQSKEARAQADASRREAKRIQQEMKSQERMHKAQIRADRQNAREYQRNLRQQNKAIDNYQRRSNARAVKSMIQLATGRPISAAYNMALSSRDSRRARDISNSMYD